MSSYQKKSVKTVRELRPIQISPGFQNGEPYLPLWSNYVNIFPGIG
jgi:hypothetical protein